MRSISFWAKQNHRKARLIIVFIHLLLLSLAIFTASLLGGMGVEPLQSGYHFLFIVPLLVAVFYPAKPLSRMFKAHQEYLSRRKICDLTIAASGYIMCILMFSASEPISTFYNRLEGSHSVTGFGGMTDSPKRYLSIPQFAKYFQSTEVQQLSAREKSKILKRQIMGIKKDKDTPTGAKIFLITFSVLIAAGLISILLGLSCNIACSGSGVLAVFVFMTGTAGVIFLLVRFIQMILGKGKWKKKQDTPPPRTD
jgi:hypothetical protein